MYCPEKLTFSRSDISGQEKRGWTPLHYAGNEKQERIAEFLLEEEKKIKAEREEGGGMPDAFRDTPTPSYNMLDEKGASPAFWTSSSKIMEMMLQFDDLEVVRRNESQPLLWECARRGIVTEKIAMDERLRGQVAEVYLGTLPLEQGECMNDWLISGLGHSKKFNLIPRPHGPRLQSEGNHWWPPVEVGRR